MGFFTATIHVVKMMLHMLFFYVTGMCANDVIMVFCKKHKKHEGFAIPHVYQFEQVASAIHQES
jgi:hypothetical protein